MRARVLAPPALLMTMTDIAELAGVQRPVVTKWRCRHPGSFPAPVGGDEANPRFNPHEVANWLLTTGRIERERAEQELALFMLTGLAANYQAQDAITAVTALICLRYLAGENDSLADGASDPVAAACMLASDFDPGDDVVLTEIRSIPPRASWLIGLVDDLIEASWGCREAFERVMAIHHRFGPAAQVPSALITSALAPPLARLIAELSGAGDRGRRGQLVVADPAAGSGDLLAEVVRLLGLDNPPRIAAAEPDPMLARLARRRMLVHGVQQRDLEIQIGGELPDTLGDPDVIVAQLPYQPGEARDLAAAINAVDNVALRLSPGRFAVVLGPAAALTDELPYSAAHDARVRLLADDMVEAVIRLPGGMLPFRPGYETALWVLTQARGSRWQGRVLLADVSAQPLNHAVLGDLVEDVVTWRREGYQPGAHRRRYGQQMAVSDLIDRPRSLVVSGRPASPRARAAEGNRRITDITGYGAELDRIGAHATAARRHVPTEALASASLSPAVQSIGALLRTRRLILRKGTRIKKTHLSSPGHHAVLGTEEVAGVRRPGLRRIDREIFVQAYPNARLTEPGDILVTTTPRPSAMVDRDGFSIAEFPVRILRIPAAEVEQFTPRLLAALLFADGSGTRAPGAVRAGRALEDQRVLLFPPDQVRRLDQLLAGIEARRDLAREELGVLDELQAATIGGLIDGTLTLTNDELSGQEE
jgi:N-6 DNA methylase